MGTKQMKWNISLDVLELDEMVEANSERLADGLVGFTEPRDVENWHDEEEGDEDEATDEVVAFVSVLRLDELVVEESDEADADDIFAHVDVEDSGLETSK